MQPPAYTQEDIGRYVYYETLDRATYFGHNPTFLVLANLYT